MLRRKPVIVSSCNSLKRIIEETQAGLVFEAGDDKDFAEKIFTLSNDDSMMEKFGNNGKAAVLNKYNFEEDGKKLVNLYKAFFKL